MTPLQEILFQVRADRRRQPYNRSESDRWKSATGSRPLEHLVEAMEEARSTLWTTQDHLSHRLETTFGVTRQELHNRCISGHWMSPWFIAPFQNVLQVHWSPIGGDDARDWFVEPLDMTLPEDKRVYVGERYTMVMSEGEGIELMETSRRIEPLELKFHRRGQR